MDEGELFDEYCDPGELWRVIEVSEPCPHKDGQLECETQNRGHCPNQRLVLRLERTGKLYTSCLYRHGRKVFDATSRTPVGAAARRPPE
jgi:hypothetical protein